MCACIAHPFFFLLLLDARHKKWKGSDERSFVSPYHRASTLPYGSRHILHMLFFPFYFLNYVMMTQSLITMKISGFTVIVNKLVAFFLIDT